MYVNRCFNFYNGNHYISNRYEEVEVRKKLEAKERQEEKNRMEEITEKDGGRGSPKASANKKDSKKVAQSNYEYTLI